MNGFALGLGLKRRLRATQKWDIGRSVMKIATSNEFIRHIAHCPTHCLYKAPAKRSNNFVHRLPVVQLFVGSAMLERFSIPC